MTTSLIPADDTGLLLCVFTGTAYLAVTAEQRGPLKGVPGAAIVFVIAAIAANMGLLPRSAPFYDMIWKYLVPMAIAMFLIKADLFKIVKLGGRTLIGFLLGTMGVVLGVLLGSSLFDLGPEHAKLAGMFSAGYIGGSLNFAAVAQAVGLEDRAVFASALAIDNIMGNACMVLLMTLAVSSTLKRRFHWRSEGIGLIPPDSEHQPAAATSARDLLGLLSVAALVLAVAQAIANALNRPALTMLLITLLMTLLATFVREPMRKLQGEEALATICMYMFIAMVGAGLDVRALFLAAPDMIFFVLFIISVHLLCIFGIGYFLKLNYAELIMASLACITGPPIVAALAISYRWNSLLVPGVMAGILGYAGGNYIGLLIFKVLS